MKQRILFLMMALFGLYGQIMAQTTVTGNVKDGTGEPIIGSVSTRRRDGVETRPMWVSTVILPGTCTTGKMKASR